MVDLYYKIIKLIYEIKNWSSADLNKTFNHTPWINFFLGGGGGKGGELYDIGITLSIVQMSWMHSPL